MRTIILNIGLNVGNKESKFQLEKTLETVKPLGVIQDIKVETGIYNNQSERTAVIKIEVVANEFNIRNAIANIAYELNQDCIAIYNPSENDGEVIYNKDYQGKQISFNNNYFLI